MLDSHLGVTAGPHEAQVCAPLTARPSPELSCKRAVPCGFRSPFMPRPPFFLLVLCLTVLVPCPHHLSDRIQTHRHCGNASPHPHLRPLVLYSECQAEPVNGAGPSRRVMGGLFPPRDSGDISGCTLCWQP
ncbi:hypothetical protein HJG60_011142 [Phyllostomus discolor]|uniref:Uncharacterized protein n=1 Tax=Phyllostomus discolor TaxID=89673 RepID=A0A834A3H0_9CHIR|nr:hypothetical protein HJG60_011142 [Phyllostomus discolor]